MSLQKANSQYAVGQYVWTVLSVPFRLVFWPFLQFFAAVDKHFLAYLFGRGMRNRNGVYSVKFIWYGDSVYLHPMVWGSAMLYLLAQTSWVPAGWPLILWFIGLAVCFLTVMYNFDVIKTSILGVGLVAVLSLCYIATMEFAWNPLGELARHITSLHVAVTPGFFLVSAYVFAALIICEMLWAWMFHRVEMDESYVYEHGFLQGTSREPIFARSMRRETKDLLELLLLGAADIQHRTKRGFKRFSNVPFASLWVGTAIDDLLDRRRKHAESLTSKSKDDDGDQVRIEDAMQEELDDYDSEDDTDDDDQDVEA